MILVSKGPELSCVSVSVFTAGCLTTAVCLSVCPSVCLPVSSVCLWCCGFVISDRREEQRLRFFCLGSLLRRWLRQPAANIIKTAFFLCVQCLMNNNNYKAIALALAVYVISPLQPSAAHCCTNEISTTEICRIQLCIQRWQQTQITVEQKIWSFLIFFVYVPCTSFTTWIIINNNIQSVAHKQRKMHIWGI